MQNLDNLLSALSDFEAQAVPSEKKAAAGVLRRLSRKFEIQTMDLVEQRLRLTWAESNNNRDELRELSELSQHAEIREWAKAALSPRGPMYPRFAV